MRLVLASTSPARLALLTAAGVDPVVVPSEVDERAAEAAAEQRLGRPLTPDETVLLLARAKAEAVHAALGAPADELLLGGDSAFAFDGVTYGKPLTAAAALDRWRTQRGRSGVLHSGHWLIDRRDGSGRGAATRATVVFAADLDDAEITAYVASGEPLAVAGAFTVDGLAGAFIDRIDGDPSTVVGASLPAIRRLVRDTGTPWTGLWRGAPTA